MSKIAPILSNGRYVPVNNVDYTSISSMHFDGNYYHVNSKNILFALTFEQPEQTSKWLQEMASPLTLSTTVYKNYRYSARIELNKTDADVAGSKRCELTCNAKLGQERWYGFSNYFPSAYASDTEGEIVAQWHQHPDLELGEDWRNPPLSLQIQNDTFQFVVSWDADAVTTNSTKDGTDFISVGTVLKDQWIDWVVHVKFSYSSDGILEVWKNGSKVINRQGGNCYNDATYPFFKIGIYKWGWKENLNASSVSQRVLYYDEVRIGNENCTYNDVAPN